MHHGGDNSKPTNILHSSTNGAAVHTQAIHAGESKPDHQPGAAAVHTELRQLSQAMPSRQLPLITKCHIDIPMTGGAIKHTVAKHAMVQASAT